MIIKNMRKSVGSLSLLPFISLMVNSSVWSFYGLLVEDFTVLVPNVTGMLVGVYCTSIYHQHSASFNKDKYYWVAAITVIGTFTLFMNGSADIIGLIGCGFAVFLMGSPLSTMGTVLATRSTESMPFYTSLAAFLNAFSWSLYGLLVSFDPMIYVPNLLGLAITSIQMLLFVRFGISARPVASDMVTHHHSTQSHSRSTGSLHLMSVKSSLEV